MMPAFALPGEISPGQFGPISRDAFPRMNVTTRIMSSVGMPSVMQTDEREPGVRRFEDRVGAGGRRHEDHRRVGARLVHRLGDGVEDRPAFVGGAALARRDAADDRRAVCGGRLGVKRAFAAREALDEETRGCIE